MTKICIFLAFVSLLTLILLLPASGEQSIWLSWLGYATSMGNGVSEHGNHVASTTLLVSTQGSHTRAQEPALLRLVIRLVGNDWLGADWVYLALTPYRYPLLDKNGQQVMNTDPKTGEPVPQWNSTRFWVDPGPALLKPGDIIWVWGYLADSHSVYADNIQVNPPSRVAPPDDISAFGKVLAVSGQTISIQDPAGISYSVSVDGYTAYSFPPNLGLPRPQQGLWVNISWLTGATGFLGRYDGYHGNYRGILRLDFGQP